MVYNCFSLRMWLEWPRSTWRAWLHDRLGSGAPETTTAAQRVAYDPSSDGSGLPETAFFSRKRAITPFHRFAEVQCRAENCDALQIRGRSVVERQTLLHWIGRLGLDLYITARR